MERPVWSTISLCMYYYSMNSLIEIHISTIHSFQIKGTPTQIRILNKNEYMASNKNYNEADMRMNHEYVFSSIHVGDIRINET